MPNPGLTFPLNFFNEMWSRIDRSNRVERDRKEPKHPKQTVARVNHQARYRAITRERRKNGPFVLGKQPRKATRFRASEFLKAA